MSNYQVPGCANAHDVSFLTWLINTLVKGRTPIQKDMTGWQKAGLLDTSRVQPPCQPHYQPSLRLGGGKDDLPRTAPLKPSQGSGGRPLGWGCCCCPPSAPHSAPAPISAGPPRTAPCLSTGGGDREKGVRSSVDEEWPGPSLHHSKGGSEEPGGSRALKDGNGQDHIAWS